MFNLWSYTNDGICTISAVSQLQSTHKQPERERERERERAANRLSSGRTTANNKLNSDASNFIRNINNTLRKNRRILAGLNPSGTTKVSKTDLLDQGFKFSYFTNEYITQKGKVYKFCYDYGYLKLENDIYAIVIKKTYVE